MAAPIQVRQDALKPLIDAIQNLQVTIGETSLDWPAWVQAVGSVLAIFVAILLGWVQYSQRGKEIAAEAERIRTLEIGSRAQFFHMISSQVYRALSVTDSIKDEHKQFKKYNLSSEDWIDFCKSALERVIKNCVTPLEVIRSLPYDTWPDLEAAFEFRKALARMEDGFAPLREAYKVPVRDGESENLAYWSDIVQVIELVSECYPHDIDRLIMISEHAISQAEDIGLDVRYGSGHAPLNLAAAIDRAIQDRCGRYDGVAPFSGEEVDRGAALRSLLKSHHDWRPKDLRDSSARPLVSC